MHAHDRTYLARLGFNDPDAKNRRHDLACQYIVERAERGGAALSLLAPRTKNVAYSCGRGGCMCRSMIDRWHTSWLGPTRADLAKHEFEKSIHKGTGQYKTTIGFLDVLLTWQVTSERCPGHSFHDHPLRGESTGFGSYFEFRRSKEPPRKAAPWDRSPSGLPPAPAWLDTSEERAWWDPREPVFCAQNAGALACGRAEMGPVGLRTTLVEVKVAVVTTGDILRQVNLYRDHQPADRVVVATDFDIADGDLKTLENEDIVHVRLGGAFEEFVQRNASKAVSAGNVL